jgi:hypothetical protein
MKISLSYRSLLIALVFLVSVLSIVRVEAESTTPYHPCISMGIKKSVVFIGTLKMGSIPRSKVESDYFGTGFLISYDQMFYLVTAKHVIEGFKKAGGKDEQISIFLNGLDGKIRIQPLAEIESALGVDWTLGKDSDLAIIPFGIRKDFDVKVVPENMFLESGQLLELQDLFFISFQPGINASDSITPITRRGMVSVLNRDGSFYMDAFAFPGNSGSPVFIKPSAATFAEKGFRIGDPNACHFVGIIGEYLPYQELAISTQTKRPRVIFEENTGLAKVWPAQALREIISSSDFASQHKRIKEKLEKAK